MSGADGRCDREGSGEAPESDATAVAPGPELPEPDAVIGRVPTGESLWRELAAAARTRGLASSIGDELIEIRDALAAIEVEPVDLDAARRRVAAASGEEERLKERVAALRGGVQARREIEAETEEALGDLESAAAELSAAQSDRIAAEQALHRARERAADARDARERRLELRDRLRNRRRDARRELAREVYSAFRDALSVVPGADPTDAGADPGAYDGPPLAASLAAVRIAEIDGPVVLGSGAIRWIATRGGAVPESVIDASVVRPCRRSQ
ncbi:hypothetical protein C471_06698 [Halorubrum saccharovorum DSM 1137]|uniref:Uncharacterized protein n=1 Tax=Halorubrum saccharovorum DSM 1137 TaxID=1227484 RepID=M0E296_9EURY|nr:hypothetical protein [Halorubrum saccharovorum]ELZ41163.1 hypothetical protein C471_06698 [Halorubrum saccharovorum DSM 1137]